MSNFDLNQFAPAETGFLHLKSPVDEEPLFVTGAEYGAEGKDPVGITFHAPGSDAYEAAAARRTNRSLARAKKNIPATADLLRSDTVDFLTDVTSSLHHLAAPAAPDAIGKEAFKALYADRKFGWIVEQVNAHLGDWANFTKKGSTSTATS